MLYLPWTKGMSFLLPVLSDRKVLSNLSGCWPSPLSTKV